MRKKIIELFLLTTTFLTVVGCSNGKKKTSATKATVSTENSQDQKQNHEVKATEVKQQQNPQKSKAEFVKLYQEQIGKIKTGAINHHQFSLEIPQLKKTKGSDVTTTVIAKNIKCATEFVNNVPDKFSLGKVSVMVGNRQLTGEIRTKGDQRLISNNLCFQGLLIANEFDLTTKDFSLTGEQKIAELCQKNLGKYNSYDQGEYLHGGSLFGLVGSKYQLAIDFFKDLNQKLNQVEAQSFQLDHGNYVCSLDQKTLLSLLNQENSPLKVRNAKNQAKKLKETEDELNANFARYPNLKEDFKKEKMDKAKQETVDSCTRTAKITDDALKNAKKLTLTFTINPEQKTIVAKLDLKAQYDDYLVTTEVIMTDQVLKQQASVEAKMPEDDKIIKETDFNNLLNDIAGVNANKGA